MASSDGQPWVVRVPTPVVPGARATAVASARRGAGAGSDGTAGASAEAQPLVLLAMTWAGGGPAGYRTWVPLLSAPEPLGLVSKSGDAVATSASTADDDGTASTAAGAATGAPSPDCGPVELWSALLPGRERRLGQTPCTSMSEVVSQVAASAEAEGLLARPYAIYGHSLGARVAFELARLLCARAAAGRDSDAAASIRAPIHVIVSGAPAPQLPKVKVTHPVHTRPLEGLVEHLRGMGGTPNEVLENVEMMELFAPMIRGDYQLYYEYEYSDGDPLPVPITCLCGRDDVSSGLLRCACVRSRVRSPVLCRVPSGCEFGEV